MPPQQPHTKLSPQQPKNLLRPRLLLILLPLILTTTTFQTLHLLHPLQINTTWSPVITATDGSVLHAFLSKDDKWRMKAELSEISPVLQKAVLLKEDRYFYLHPGINPVALVRAMLKNAVQGKTTSGASTITMQVARLLDPRPRTYRNKLREMFRALQLELMLSKDEILALYLNLLPFGGNVEGVKAAAVLYFQQAPDRLSLAQAVTLSVIPNKPSSMRLGSDNGQTRAFRNKWLRYLEQEGAFPAEQIADALEEPLEAVRENAPQEAPHLALLLRRKYPEEAVIRSTLNRALQEKAERLTYNYMRRLQARNIGNAAVIVINNRTKAVEAYLGSADFGDAERAGQVDGVQAIRSPGSTLKPFLYATAIDRGLITPKSVVSDVPVDYAGYRPENYFGTFNGNVTIEHSLKTSLNVPAVKVLEAVGVPAFVQKLGEADFRQVRKDGPQLGLSLILGGCGVRLEELATLYASLADGGEFSSLRWRQEDSVQLRKQVFSPASAYLITGILTQLTRPDLPHNAHNSRHLPQIAWKTGTSYGRKDAWSIGYNGNYTIGVWVGNFSGEGVPELKGTDSATPLLFDLFNALDYNASASSASTTWRRVPAELKQRAVCAESGLPANHFCRDQVLDGFLPGISDPRTCSHLKQVPVSADGQVAYCALCLPAEGAERRWFPNHAPELLTFFETERLPYQKLPPHNPACGRIFAENAPRITSPAEGLEYLLEREEAPKLMLRCNAHNEVKQVYWYVNDRFLQAGKANEKVFFTLAAGGKVKISCTDDQGRNTDAWVTVRYVQ
jgi:penicillin-binding protein 1C